MSFHLLESFIQSIRESIGWGILMGVCCNAGPVRCEDALPWGGRMYTDSLSQWLEQAFRWRIVLLSTEKHWKMNLGFTLVCLP